jgi:putative spermidine/putrescine transport system ATP-binding protein
MSAGRIVQIGRGEDLYRAPQHPFVAEFLGRVNRLQRAPDAVAVGVLHLGGAAFACPPTWKAHTTLLIRPEDLEVGAPQAGWGAATVEQRTFLGDRVQLKLRADGQPLLVADVGRDIAFVPGDSVGVRIDPDRLMTSQELA